MINFDLYFSLLLTLFSGIALSAELSVERCLEIGFRKTDLLCSGCEKLEKFQLNELKRSCDQCCRNDTNEHTVEKKYWSARLEICECKLNAYPQIAAFIRSDPTKRFDNFSIKYVNYAEPKLKLLDSNHKVVDVLNIQKWDTDTIEEYLRQF